MRRLLAAALALSLWLAACGGDEPQATENDGCLLDGSCELLDPADAIDLGEFTAEQIAEAVNRFEYQVYAKRIKDGGGEPVSYEAWKHSKGPRWLNSPEDIVGRPFPKAPPELNLPKCVPMVRRGPKGVPIFYCR